MRRTFLCGALLLACAGQASAADPRPTAASAGAIDRALLMSEFYILGMRFGLEQSLGERGDKAKIASCFQANLTPVAQQTFAQIIGNGLTEEQLQKGAALATAPVFAKLNEYIRANRGALTAEAKAAGQRMDHYFLLTSASRLNVAAEDKKIVEAFVNWHTGVVPKFNEQFRTFNPQMIEKSQQFAAECAR